MYTKCIHTSTCNNLKEVEMNPWFAEMYTASIHNGDWVNVLILIQE